MNNWNSILNALIFHPFSISFPESLSNFDVPNMFVQSYLFILEWIWKSEKDFNIQDVLIVWILYCLEM